MEVQIGPDSIDEPSLLYKLQRKIKVFNTNDPLPNRGYNLVASSSKYGLVFVAVPDGTLSVYQLNQLIDKECEPQHLSIKLQEKPTHITVSCDFELLAVTGGKYLAVYKVVDFQNATVQPSLCIRTEVEPSYVSALQWNPCIPDSIVMAFYDGTLLACLVSSGQVKKVTGRARCICWSPKGKQLVTGNSDGTLIQYKPELTAAKLIPAPNLFDGSPVEAMAIYWISTFQFAVVYRNAVDNSRPAVTIVNTPKAGQPSCISYEDICYSMGSNRPWYYYLHGLAQWNIIMTSSSNSMEIGTLGSTDGANWLQWSQSDDARPELPLTDKKVENYPVGLSIDTCAIHQLPWGENETLPHMPLLHVVSEKGVLTIFNVINLKNATQLCSPPQLLTLPAQALTSAIPGAVQAVQALATNAAPTAPKTGPAVSVIQQALQSSAQPIPQSSSVTTSATIKIPSFTPPNNQASTPSINQQPEPRLSAQTAPGQVFQPQATVAQPKPQPQSQPQPAAPKPQIQENANIKAEQEKANKAKANQELKDMLVKEVNDFQTELYNFMVKTRETQARLQRDIDTISSNFNGISLDTEELKKECSMEELRGAIVQLKLELVRACAVVAEARTHSDAKDLHQWSQADPLTTKRVASVKKLAYYVQTQLAQAHAALDYKWNEMASRDPQYNKPGKRMIRPILDDVYQPLVKQQEILSRQQAVLRTLKSTLAECDVGPIFKSTSLLRSTPFRNNKDPLSKLTKNILNMSLEPETKPKRQLLTPTKLDALRDALSNHKTIKIKPINVELRQHLEILKKNYEKSVKEKAEKVQSLPPPAKMVKVALKAPKPEPSKAPVATFTPVANAKPPPAPSNVVRTLFTDEPNQEATAPQPAIPRPVSKPFDYPPATQETPSIDTKSVLKDVLTNRQANLEAKNNSNTFMGQKICSPSAFAQPSAPTPSSAPTAVFTSKPITEISNMFNKIQPQPFIPETKSTLNARQADKPTPSTSNIKSSETGEPEDTEAPKPMTNLFGMKTPLAASTPLPSTSKTSQEQKPLTTKPLEKLAEKAKENVPERVVNVSKVAEKKDAKPLSSQANKGFVFGASQSNEASGGSSSGDPKPLQKIEIKTETQKGPEKSNAAVSSAQSIFGSVKTTISTPKPSAQKPQLSFAASTSSVKTEPEPSSPSASSIFGAAVASQPKTTSSFSSPTNVFTSTPPAVVFGNSSPGSTSAAQVQIVSRSATTSADSIFEPVSTSQPIFSSNPPVLSMSAAHPQATYITDRLKYQAGDNSGGSIFKPVLQATATETPVSEATTTASVFGSSSVTVKTVFGSGTSAFGATTSTTGSVFGSTSPGIATSTTVAVIFGSSTSTVASTTTTATVFASATPTIAPTTASSVFGASSPGVVSTTAAPLFGSATPSVASVFGATTTVSSASSIFGSAQATFPSTEATSAFTPTTTSIFGATKQPSSVFSEAAQSVFGATSQASIFGAPTTQSVFSPTTQAPVFGSSTTTQASIFGSPTMTTQTSIFGTPTVTTQASVFGTPTQPSSVFGTPTQTTQASVFGTPTQTTQASVFGTPTQTTQASVFGTPTQTTQASVFGTPTQTTQASVFGTPTQTTQASVFGTPTQTTQASIFGQPATSVQSGGSLFGGGETNLFGAASISTTNAQTPSTGGNIFGSSSGSVFGGGGTNVFGGKAAFGQQTQAASIFGGGASFGQKPATNLWGTGNTTGNAFGASGFGQPATTQASSIFGGTSGGSFSQPSAGAFGAPPQPTAFGSPTQQQAPAFGGGSVFGSKSLFGQSTGFGSPTSGGFGSPAAFGTFNKSPGGGSAFGAPAFGAGSSFGGGSPGGGFGTPTQSNATFESLATQNTLTFGNLAQQSGPPQPAAPSFNTSPSFTGWRG